MFVLEEQPLDQKAFKESLISILQSINEPKIAAEDYAAEPTQAFVFTSQARKKLETRIVLFLTQTRENIVYAWEDGAYDPANRSEVEEAALDFVEGMGFMMDNLNFSKLPADQKSALLAEIPIMQAAAVEEEEPLTGEIVEEVPEPATDDAAVTRPVHRNVPLRAEPVSAESALELEELVREEAPAIAGATRVPMRPVAASEDSGAAIEALEAEFQRDDDVLGEELDSMFSALDSGPAQKSGPVRDEIPNVVQHDNERWRAWIRLMASF